MCAHSGGEVCDKHQDSVVPTYALKLCPFKFPKIPKLLATGWHALRASLYALKEPLLFKASYEEALGCQNVHIIAAANSNTDATSRKLRMTALLHVLLCTCACACNIVAAKKLKLA